MPDAASSLDAPELGVSGAMVRRGAQMVRRHVALEAEDLHDRGLRRGDLRGGHGRAVVRVRVDRRPRHHAEIRGRRTSALTRSSAASIALVVVGAVRAAGVVLRRVNAGRTQMGVAAILRRDVVDRYQDEPLAYFHENPTGELLAHVQSDAEASSQVLGPLPYASGTVMLVVIATVWMFATDWVLGLVALLLFPAITALERRVPAPHRGACRARAEPHRRRVERGARERRRRDRGEGARRRGVGVGEVRGRSRAAARRQHPGGDAPSGLRRGARLLAVARDDPARRARRVARVVRARSPQATSSASSRSSGSWCGRCG